ncbi:MAG: MMPL family transporter [Desulfovibrionaceae bacterium]|nr:MMPL family transporter [Desulfovibrionaceae bacterium]
MSRLLRFRVLARLARLVSDHPWPVLVLGLVLAAACVWLAATRLVYLGDRNDLLSPDLDWNRRNLERLKNFPGDDLLAVVERPQGPDGAARAERFVDALVREIEADKTSFRAAFSGFDSARSSAALIRLLPLPEFKARLRELADAAPLLAAQGPAGFVRALARRFEAPAGPGAGLEQAEAGLARLSAFFDRLARFMSGGPDPFEILGPGRGRRYFTSRSGDLFFVHIEPQTSDEVDKLGPAVAAARRALDAAERAEPGVRAGLTGVPVIEADETAVVVSDSTLCSLLAVAGVALLLILAFHGWRMPLLAVLALLFPLAWTFGFLTLAIGHLQVLSVVFTVILLGMGIDFGIHLMSRFEMVRRDYGDGPEGFALAMTDTMQTTGPGLVTGAVTTAAAFGTTAFTGFKGIAEMGLIAGAGILLCLAAMLTVFPALLRIFLPRSGQVAALERRLVNMHGLGLVSALARRPRATVWVAAGLVLVSSLSFGALKYDYNLQNLLPRGVESVTWLNRLLSGGENVWFCASVAKDPAEARARTLRFRDLPSVAAVRGAGLLFPEDEERKIKALRRTRAEISAAAPARALVPDSARGLDRALADLNRAVEARLKRSDLGLPVRVEAAMEELLQAVGRAGMALSEAGDRQAGRYSQLKVLFEAASRAGQERIDQALDTGPLCPRDLPPGLRRLAAGPDGSLQVMVFPRRDVYRPEALAEFGGQARSVDPAVVGPAIQVFESTRLMTRSYWRAGLYALAAVFALLLVDFRSLGDALFCLIPVSAGFALLFGVMFLFGVDLNPANIIILPLMFGIGVDNGVHMAHRFCQAPDDDPPGLAAGTGKGVLLTSLTTILGFALMMTARHRGIFSLGFVLAAGMSLTLAACLTLAPAVLALRRAGRRR